MVNAATYDERTRELPWYNYKLSTLTPYIKANAITGLIKRLLDHDPIRPLTRFVDVTSFTRRTAPASPA